MPTNTLALDIGEKRIGVAFAHGEVNIANPLVTLDAETADLWKQIQQLITQNDVRNLVIGLPRGLEGQENDQTRSVQKFGENLSKHINLPITWQDEALTSVYAKNILDAKGRKYEKGDIDSMAATLILTDYLESHKVSK